MKDFESTVVAFGSALFSIIVGSATNSWLIGLLTFILSVCLISFMIVQSEQKETDNAKDLYDQALASGNKRLALKYGRQYYASLREDGRLTTYDEQAIQNDLLSMDK
jgi:hypothetical protein